MKDVFTPKKIIFLLLILAIPAALIWYGSKAAHNFARLPILGPKEVDSKGDTIYHTIPPFKFVNFTGDTITQKTFKDKFYVVNFIFTTCKSICPKMSANMNILQERFAEYPDVLLLSHTVDPENDTPEVLKEYAKKVHAIEGRWFLVTGDKKELYEQARKGYFLTALEGDGGPDDFIHSENLVLIDDKGRIRGFCDGTKYKDVHDFVDAIRTLIAEHNFPRKEKK